MCTKRSCRCTGRTNHIYQTAAVHAIKKLRCIVDPTVISTKYSIRPYSTADVFVIFYRTKNGLVSASQRPYIRSEAAAYYTQSKHKTHPYHKQQAAHAAHAIKYNKNSTHSTRKKRATREKLKNAFKRHHNVSRHIIRRVVSCHETRHVSTVEEGATPSRMASRSLIS